MTTVEPTNRERRLVLDTAIMDMEAADPFHLREILWSDGEDLFYLQLPTRRPRDGDDEARSALSCDAKLVPRSLYQTVPSPRTTYYIKVGTIFYFHPEDPEKSAIWQYMIQEARVCETLMKYPHQNVAQYYGYVEKDGMMVGLCFKRYGQTLSDAMKTGLIRREDVEHSLDQIKKGIEHIHGLGLVHNDINPRNILLDAGCNDPETAEFQNDFYGLEKIREWMEENIP
ncbi:hypothetical protein EV421DRAFT_2021725 [Armillaria borealis]|uniref:Protein kinase domain-containing protein n=1 Tax=Armillaria borealis TaxID=47425 RepID=A0AA39J752_9AGAR|nr:hypothetical protein EV421DRAFT_2021725 [Armillaria borealis]